MKNFNPNIDEFLKIYSQSLVSTGLTRGLDENTYIPTKLDTALKSDVLQGKKKLVVLTGNAGDGKTAFIQLIERQAKNNGAVFSSVTDNGCKFILDEINFETLYDGSQDFDGMKNDEVLKAFFKIFEGNSEPNGRFVKIIAINEGKLRDFILNKREYYWLGKVVYHYFEFDNYKLPEIFAFINLNNRSVIEVEDSDSILDKLLKIFLDVDNTRGFWDPCKSENCNYADRCYIKSNVETFNDADLGPVVKQRLKEIILAFYLKKEKHITMRDIRSLISFVLFNKYNCKQLQTDIDNNKNLLDRFYFNSLFNKVERDRMVRIVAEIDVSDMPLPKIENNLYFMNPKSEAINLIFTKNSLTKRMDTVYLEEYFNGKPQGTSDEDTVRKINAEMYLNSMKRKVFFEGNDSFLKEQFDINHYSFMPYKYFERFVVFLKTGDDTGFNLRNDIVLAISKSEKIYNEVVGRENVCISSNSNRKTQTKSFYGFKAPDFEVVLPEVGNQTQYIEFFPDHIIFRHVDKTASLEINIDLFEILMRIKEGYVPTSAEIQTFFLNLEMFKRRILAKRSMRVFLTEDDTNLFSFEKSITGKLVLTKI